MPRTRAPEDVRRSQILEAAVAVAARDGLADLTVRSVAAQAGLSHGSVLHHFGSREGLVEHVLGLSLAWLAEPTTAGEDRDLVRLVRDEVAAVDLDRATVLLGFWTSSAPGSTLRSRIEEAMRGYRVELARCLGHDDPDSPTADVALSLVIGAVMRRVLSPGEPALPGADLVVEVRGG